MAIHLNGPIAALEGGPHYTRGTKIALQDNLPLEKIQRVVSTVVVILPSAKGLFTPINEALQGNPVLIRIGKKAKVWLTFLDLLALVQSLTDWPTHVSKIIPGPPDYVGFCDTSAVGAGGVWFAPCGSSVAPVVWHLQFPLDISAAVLSDKKPKCKGVSN